MLPIPLSPPLLSALNPTVLISTPAVPVSDLPRPSQPQVVNATPSTLSIMARLDTLQELFMSMDSCIDARLSKMETRMDYLTFSVQQLTSLDVPSRQRGDFVTPTDTSLKVDGGTEVIRSGSNTRAPPVAHETLPILQTSSATALRFVRRLLRFQIPQDKSMVRSSFVLLTLVWKSLLEMIPLWYRMLARLLHLLWRSLIKLLHLCWRILHK